MNTKCCSLYPMFLLVCGFLLTGQHVYSQNETSIRGKLHLDSIWDPVVYLSHIPTLNDMYTMSNEMIISMSNMDSQGNFSFSTEYMPEQDQVYRIHISKKDAPPASLIIGGVEENHMFLVARNGVSIDITNLPGNPPFTPIQIAGYLPSKQLSEIDLLYTYIDSTNTEGSLMKEEFVSRAIYEKLRFIADTTSNALVSLYALHRSKFETNYPVNQPYYENYLKKWQQEDSAYFKSFRSALPIQKSNELIYYVLLGIFFFGMGYLANFFFRRKSKSPSTALQKLSVQERKILDEIKQGRSNKEISETFNIGVSTVKTHVSNIYHKLNIKSRKEAMDI